MVQGQGHVTYQLAAARHRGGPAHDGTEGFANRVLGAGVGGLLRFEFNPRLFSAGRQVGADHATAHIGADDLRNMDLARLEGAQRRPVALGLDEGLGGAADVPQFAGGQTTGGHLDPFAPL